MRRAFVPVVVIALLASCALGQNTRQTTGTIQGVVFTLDSKGDRSVVPTAKIVLDGPKRAETESEVDGLFAFGTVPPGTYKITACAIGMAASQRIVVVAGATSEVNLELPLETVKQSVMVAASDNPPKPNDPGTTNDIGESTVVDAPNVAERSESLLPLAPGVVRGSDGRMNLKATRETQRGILIDSAKVTDPATGSTSDHTASTAQAQFGQVMGTVVDLRGDAIPGAEVTLTRPGFPSRQTLSTNEYGFFEIDGVEPEVSSQIVVSATGFDDWKSPALVLEPGQVMQLGGISLELAAQNTTLTVRYNSVETAREQIKAEEKQRLFGIIPNFYVSYEGENAAPITAKMKFQLALKASFDPVTIGGAALWAGIRQATDTPNYQQGLTGYGERFGAVSADGFSHLMISDAILQSVFHEDPRYFYQGAGTTKSRLWHAISSPFWSRRDNGSWGPNYSSLGGDLVSSSLSNLYYPKSNRGAGLVFSQFAIGTAEHVVNGLAQEFILSKFTHRGHVKNSDAQQ